MLSLILGLLAAVSSLVGFAFPNSPSRVAPPIGTPQANSVTSSPMPTVPSYAPVPFAATSSGALSVSGMSKYTDSDFGFSFWYPSAMKVSVLAQTLIDPTLSKSTILKVLTVFDPQGSGFYVYEIMSDSESITATTGGCDGTKYFFDANANQWMQTWGCDPYPTSPYVASTTMGGLPELFTQEGLSSVGYIVPLSRTSAKHSVMITPSGPGDGIAYRPGFASAAIPFANTIVATDPLVASPVSRAQQIAVIRSEKAAYSSR